MYTVKRAVIMAAGIGKRMQPVTLETPKPLVNVNGKRMIDTVIDALRINGILEIYIVVGYLKEKFSVLKEKYPDIILIENPYYDSCNNIASLYVARNFLEDVIILDGDQIIYDSSILTPYFKRSGYNCIWSTDIENEWMLTTNKEGIVESCSKTGGKNGWQLYSISRWNQHDGKQLKKDVEEIFENQQQRDLYWDDIPLFCYPDHYELGIREMKKSAVVEIDSLYELIEYDPLYRHYKKGE